MTGAKKITATRLIGAIKGSQGLTSTIAVKLGCSVTDVDKAVERYPSAALALEEEIRRVADLIEAEIIQKCLDGHVQALVFFAKTRLKDRGFADRAEPGGTTPDQTGSGPHIGLDMSSLTDEQLKLLAGEVDE